MSETTTTPNRRRSGRIRELVEATEPDTPVRSSSPTGKPTKREPRKVSRSPSRSRRTRSSSRSRKSTSKARTSTKRVTSATQTNDSDVVDTEKGVVGKEDKIVLEKGTSTPLKRSLQSAMTQTSPVTDTITSPITVVQNASETSTSNLPVASTSRTSTSTSTSTPNTRAKPLSYPDTPTGASREACLTPNRIRTFEEVPHYNQDNPYIHSGYRVNFSWKQSFLSLFKLHNETMNVWTHALGMVFMGVVMYLFVQNLDKYTTDQFAYNYTYGLSTINRGMGFVTDVLGITTNSLEEEQHVFSYHESMPVFCERLYDRYQSFMSSQNLPIDGQMPRNQYMDGELILGPWEFPAQCKPLRRKIFSPSLAAKMREYLKNLSPEVRGQLHALKQYAKQAYGRVALPSSIVKSAKYISDEYAMFKNASIENIQQFLNKLDSSYMHTREAAIESYLLLRHFILPVAKANNTDIDERAVKHPAFLFKYLDLGEEFEEHLPYWPVIVYLISAMICFGCSALYHLCSGVSYEVFVLLSRMDYAGISILIGGSNIPIIYYTLYCHKQLQTMYISLMAVVCLITFVMTVHPRFSGVKWRAARTFMFIGLGIVGMIPYVHRTVIDYFDATIMFYLGLMGALYIGGAMIYIFQVPERFYPGKFDVCCASHQLWHCFVFAAALVHYMGVQYLYTHRIVNTCPISEY